MSQKQGLWVKFRERPRYSSEGKEAVRQQHDKVAKAGEMIKEKCSGKKGNDFRRCRSEVLKEIFGQKTETGGQDK